MPIRPIIIYNLICTPCVLLFFGIVKLDPYTSKTVSLALGQSLFQCQWNNPEKYPFTADYIITTEPYTTWHVNILMGCKGGLHTYLIKNIRICWGNLSDIMEYRMKHYRNHDFTLKLSHLWYSLLPNKGAHMLIYLAFNSCLNHPEHTHHISKDTFVYIYMYTANERWHYIVSHWLGTYTEWSLY